MTKISYGNFGCYSFYTCYNGNVNPYTIKKEEKGMKIYAIVNGVELGVSLNPEEVKVLGATFAEIISSSELMNSFMESVNDIVNAAANAAKPAEDEPEKKDDSLEEEDPDDKKKDDLVEKLEKMGCEVLRYGDEDLVECHTFCDKTSNTEKATLVRVWLKENSISYKIETNGIKKYIYHLTPIQLIKLQRYLKDNDIVSYDATI